MPTIISGDGTITGLTTTGISAVQKLPAGTVLQVVQGTYSTEVANGTSTYADTGLTATITPTSSTSKILVLVSQVGVGKSNDNSSNGCTLALLRASTTITTFAEGLGRTLTANYGLGFNAGTNYLDSPATTSATTYKTQFKNFTNANAVYVQYLNTTSTITLMEIAA